MANIANKGCASAVADAQTAPSNVVMAVQNHGHDGLARTGSDPAISANLQGTTALSSGTITSNQTLPVNHQATVVTDKLTADNMIAILQLGAKCEKDGEDIKGIDKAFRG